MTTCHSALADHWQTDASLAGPESPALSRAFLCSLPMESSRWTEWHIDHFENMKKKKAGKESQAFQPR